MYKLTIETESLDELYATISQLKGAATVSISGEENVKPVKEKKKAKEKMADEIKSFVKESGDPESEHEGKADEPAAKSLLGYEDIKKATLELVSSQGKPAALEVLGKFGAKNAQELKPEDFGKYVKEVNAKLEAIA